MASGSAGAHLLERLLRGDVDLKGHLGKVGSRGRGVGRGTDGKELRSDTQAIHGRNHTTHALVEGHTRPRQARALYTGIPFLLLNGGARCTYPSYCSDHGVRFMYDTHTRDRQPIPSAHVSHTTGKCRSLDGTWEAQVHAKRTGRGETVA
jgi:hypothetical protein